MDHSDNDKFGELALSLGFCTSDQIRRCLKIQGDTTENLSLGLSLFREGFISGEQYSQVLSLLRSNLKKGRQAAPDDPFQPEMTRSLTDPEVSTPEKREDDLLGKLAVREGWIAAADLQACLQQERPGSPRQPLAEILVTKGYLTPARAKDLLARVSRRLMFCRGCEKSFTVLSIANSRVVICPTCHKSLEEGKLPDRRPAKDPLATQTFRIISKALPPSRRPRLR